MIIRVTVPSFRSFISIHSVWLKPTPDKPLLEMKIIRLLNVVLKKNLRFA